MTTLPADRMSCGYVDCLSATTLDKHAISRCKSVELAVQRLAHRIILATREFYTLLTRELDAVHRLAHHLAPSRQDTEDLVQETFLRALKAADRFQPNELGPRPWLFKILHNVVFTRYHSTKRQTALLRALQVDFDASQCPAENAVSSDCLSDMRWDDVGDELKAAIAELPLSPRMTFLLHAIEGLKYREIAIAMDVPVGTVMSRLSRARDFLAARLQTYARERGWCRSEPSGGVAGNRGASADTAPVIDSAEQWTDKSPDRLKTATSTFRTF